MKIILITWLMMICRPGEVLALLLDDSYQISVESNRLHIFEKDNDGKLKEMVFKDKNAFYRFIMTDPGLKFSFYKRYNTNVDKLFSHYFDQHQDSPVVFYEDELKALAPEEKLKIKNKGKNLKENLEEGFDQLVDGTYSKGPTQFIIQTCGKEPNSEFFTSDIGKEIFLDPCPFFKSEKETAQLLLMLEDLQKYMVSETLTTAQEGTDQLQKNQELNNALNDLKIKKCGVELSQLGKEMIFLKGEDNPYDDKNSFKGDDGGQVICAEKTRFGGPCYTQRISCITSEEKEKFKADGWHYPRNDSTWRIQVPILYSEAGKIKETTDYSYGSASDPNLDFNTINSDKKIHKKKSQIFQAALDDSKPPELSSRDLPQYALDTQIPNFRLAEYPFFRPEDQCSVPVTNTQGVGGVCFQMACKEHDYCFQSLPLSGKIGVSDFKKHFDECNDHFKKNIFKLCSTAGNFVKRYWGYVGAEIFYTGVQYGPRLIGGRDGMGQDFLKSQRDQAVYLSTIYQSYATKYCSNININSVLARDCTKINSILLNLDIMLTNKEK